ncbi:hypothetical protein BJV78DRAFT_1261476 [Lactifluus subvellereus]|nr:hypothetical protein BJV78DRAFT_1261476 [Lactifluus subvellereus]
MEPKRSASSGETSRTTKNTKPATPATLQSMEHILIHCNATPTRAIWELARTTWPHNHRLWPDTTIGIILGPPR